MTLEEKIEAKITQQSRERAQAETAKGRLSGKLTAEDAGPFEDARFVEINKERLQIFRKNGHLLGALPSIEDLARAGRAPMITTNMGPVVPPGPEVSARQLALFRELLGEVSFRSEPACD